MPCVVYCKALSYYFKRLYPDTRIIFMTGYAEDPITMPLDAGVLLLNKPFRKSELAQAVRQFSTHFP